MTPGFRKRFVSGLTITATVCLLSVSAVSHANEQMKEQAASRITENINEEAESDDQQDDGSSALQDRYMHLDLKNIKPLSLEEEEALLGNWGDSEAEDGD